MPQRAIPPPLRPPQRVPAEQFRLPVDRIREGYYSDKYFVRTRDLLLGSRRNPQVTMQVFQKQDAWLGGVDEAIAILESCLTDGYTWGDIEVRRVGERAQMTLPAHSWRDPQLREIIRRFGGVQAG